MAESRRSDLLQGTLDLLILKTLAPGRCTAGASPSASSRSPTTCSGQPGLALPGALPARGAGLDRVGMGRLREQPAREVLPADARGRRQLAGRRATGSASPRPWAASWRPPEGRMTLAHKAPVAAARAVPAATRLEREMDDELRFHLEMETEKNVKRGPAPEEARRAALRRLRRRRRVKDECRDAWGVRALERPASRTCATGCAACAATRASPSPWSLTLGARHRRQHRDLQRRQRRAAAAAALRRRRAARGPAPDRAPARRRRPRLLGAGSLRLPRAEPHASTASSSTTR